MKDSNGSYLMVSSHIVSFAGRLSSVVVAPHSALGLPLML